MLDAVDLEGWFADHGRDLPWRRTRDPWSILVSEIMLQQTQVSRVIDRWHRFLDRFPTPAVTAGAPVAAVIDEWSGLGYNRRAVNLHRCAVAVTERFGGTMPATLDELLSLPGVGAYTARAVAVFAFEQDEAVVDTNVARILARTAGRTMTRAEVQRLADECVVGRDPWAWNQAMLDVGAAYCRPDPDCGPCPFSPVCRWHLAGGHDPDPADGSAGVSGRQSRFEGSDRQGRGRLVRALRHGPVADEDLAAVMGWADDTSRAERVAATLVADGLTVHVNGRYLLPS
ncbi:MAG: A/G-specific adenine glycosylase [Acidimicrobiia bacterium]|nr:A/G-specific adenine glycosylase [Acidimicrobiia bacterium]